MLLESRYPEGGNSPLLRDITYLSSGANLLKINKFWNKYVYCLLGQRYCFGKI